MENLHFEEEPTGNSRIHDFLHLSKEEMAELTIRLAKHNGLIRIFMHPTYQIYHDRGEIQNEAKQEADDQKARKIFEFLVKIMKTDLDDSPPLLIMDDYIEAEWLKEQYEMLLNDSDNEIYLARTAANCSLPLMEEMPSEVDERAFIQLQSSRYWLGFLTILKEAGVRTVILGGSDYEIVPRTIEEMPDDRISYFSQRLSKMKKARFSSPKWCVGDVAEVLAYGGIQVELSNFALPHARGEQIRFESGKENWRPKYERNEKPEETE